MSEEVHSYKMQPGPGKGKGKVALDKLFEGQKGPGSSRRIARENTSDDCQIPNAKAPKEWTRELENSLIAAVEKYRNYGFASSTTFDIIKKDRDYKDLFGDRPISALSRKFTYLVNKERATGLVPNDTVVDGLFGAGVGGEQNQPIGVLVEKFLDLASEKFTTNALSIFLPAMREELKKNKN